MSTMLLGRPLTFGDEAQIAEIKKQEINKVLFEDVAIKGYAKEIRAAEQKINEAEEERDELCREAEKEIQRIYSGNHFLQEYNFRDVCQKFYMNT